jgi:glycosyltransferase involved in cell wall biosynthesis
MTRHPRTVFGMPACNRPDALGRTLESLLSQTCRDFALVIVDDWPSSEVESIIARYAPLHPSVTYEPNPTRLGMIANWRKAFERSRQLYPNARYFAWVSDHDIWHPRWLDVLSRVLDSDPSVVLAYPLMMRVYPGGRRSLTELATGSDADDRGQRLRGAIAGMTAGNAVYGLIRVDALEWAGVFRRVLLPDRLLLVQLSLRGRIRHVPEILWYREVAGAFSYRRQRRMFFPGRPPLHTYLPPALQHVGVLLWDLVVQGTGRPAFGRLAGLQYAALHWWLSSRRALLRHDAWWRGPLDRVVPARERKTDEAVSRPAAAGDNSSDARAGARLRPASGRSR